MACNSGLFEMMAEARLMGSRDMGLGGADAALFAAPGGGDGLPISFAAAMAWVRFKSADCLCDGAGAAVATAWGLLKASSARASVTILPKLSGGFEGEVGLSKSNLAPWSCRIANWSRDGNLAEASSVSSLLPVWESRAAKGSPLVTLIGEGLGLAACGAGWGWAAPAGGLPRLIGVTSGIFGWDTGGGEKTAPTTGVLPARPWSGDRISDILVSAGERPE